MPTAAWDTRFTVIAPLGRGGTAEVTRVRLSDSGREAALKAPLPSDPHIEGDFATLARREFELIGGHRFPGLVRLLEPPHTDPDYLLLELCEGPTVDKIGKVESPSVALNLVSALAMSLEYLRARGIIHGDLKPQNIFLPHNWNKFPSGRLWYAKISDFSLGRKADEPETLRAGLGTVGYMAPEVIAQKTTSHQSDLFALGVIAYQLLTGQHPFLIGDCEPVKVNSRIQEESPTPIEQLRPDLSGHPVISIINSLLAKEPLARPKSAFVVCRMLEQAGSDFPYGKGIRPRYLWDEMTSPKVILATLADLTQADRAQLTHFTGGDADLLKEVVSSNWAIGNLQYVDGRFQVRAGIRWPALLRRRELTQFRALSLSDRKQLIVDAASYADARESAVGTPRLVLLRQLLRQPTVKKLGLKFAPGIERSGDFVRATLAWLAAGDLVGAERCALQAATMLTKTDHRREALVLANRVIDFARTAGRLQEVLELLLLSGTLLKDSGDTAGAEAIYNELIADLSSKPVSKTLGIVYNKLGDLYKMRSDFDAGLAALEKALTIFEQLDDQLEYSHTCNNLGNVFWVIGDLRNSVRQYRRALRLQRRLNATSDVASTLSNLGGVTCMMGRFARGVYFLEASLAMKRELGDTGEIARTLNNLGYVSYISGDNAKAVEYLSESLELNRRVGSRKEILINIENLTSIMISAGQLGKSLALVREGLTLSREIGDVVQEMLLQTSLGNALVRLGQIGEAQKVLAEVAGNLGKADDPAITVAHRCACAEIEMVLGRTELARELLQEAGTILSVDPFVRSKVVLLTSRLENVTGSAEEVERLIVQTQFGRLRLVYDVNCAERLLREHNHAAALQLVSDHFVTLATTDDEIESPRMNGVVARVLMANDRIGEALAHCRWALAQAKRFGSIVDLFETGVLAGQLQFKSGDYEQSFREYRQAIQFAKGIASSFTDQQDRADFQNRHEIKFMLGEIERLGLILGQKKAGRREPARA
jgi:serine/threonine protein kinase/tetratricopeptide (TPR) repeat protein